MPVAGSAGCALRNAWKARIERFLVLFCGKTLDDALPLLCLQSEQILKNELGEGLVAQNDEHRENQDTP